MNTRLLLSLLLSITFAVSACGGDDGESSGSTSNATSSSNGTTSSNSTTSTSNGTTSNGTTSTSNGTTSTSNGTTSTSNGTTATSNGTTTFEGVGLQIDEGARSCELVLLDPQNAVQEITFNDTVEGRSMRRGERLAIAFHATSDASIDPGAVAFVVAENGADMLNVTVPRCFDAQGKVIEDAILDINR